MWSRIARLAEHGTASVKVAAVCEREAGAAIPAETPKSWKCAHAMARRGTPDKGAG